MSRTRGIARLPAYTLVIVLLACFLVLTFAVIMSGLVAVEWGRDRQAALDARAGQIIASAQAWSHRHAAELATGQSLVLPLGDLLPAEMAGTAELHCIQSATGDVLFTCKVTVQRAGRHLTRQAVWPRTAGK